MKKRALLCVPLFVFLPAIGMAASCLPYNVNYALQANGASGTLVKSQIISGNQYSITSTINVSKFFVTKTIVQTATGTCDAQGNIVAQQLIVNKDNAVQTVPLNEGVFDSLSLVASLSNGLRSGLTSFSPFKLWYSGNVVSILCQVIDLHASVSPGNGQSIPATNVICASPDKTLVLGYSFSQDSQGMMLSATSTENGTQNLTAIINLS